MADDEAEEASETTADEAADATGLPASGGGDGAGDADDGDKSGGEPDGDDADHVAAAGLVGDGTEEKDGGAEGSAEADQEGDGGDEGDGFDVEAAETRLEDVEGKIEEGRRALADLENEVEPEPEGQPIAEGDGAANAPPG